MTDRYIVMALWDEEANVWVATSDDIPGLVTEAPTLDALLQRVTAVTPELLEDNAHQVVGYRPGAVIDIHIVSELQIPPVAAE